MLIDPTTTAKNHVQCICRYEPEWHYLISSKLETNLESIISLNGGIFIAWDAMTMTSTTAMYHDMNESDKFNSEKKQSRQKIQAGFHLYKETCKANLCYYKSEWQIL